MGFHKHGTKIKAF